MKEHKPMTPRVISIKQPWAYAICAGKKNIENRTWSTKYRGPLLIHAGLKSKFTPENLDFCKKHGVTLPEQATVPVGGVVGIADLVDVVTHSKSPWFAGDFGFVLRNARHLPLTPSKGSLGIYYPDPALVAELTMKGFI